MAIDTKPEKVVTYKVYYEAKPSYGGEWNIPSKPGFQGPFHQLDKAEEAAESCKRWFNEERRLNETTDRDGTVKQEVRTIVHDNVNIEIKKFIDGFPAPEDVTCEEEPIRTRKKQTA